MIIQQRENNTNLGYRCRLQKSMRGKEQRKRKQKLTTVRWAGLKASGPWWIINEESWAEAMGLWKRSETETMNWLCKTKECVNHQCKSAIRSWLPLGVCTWFLTSLRYFSIECNTGLVAKCTQRYVWLFLFSDCAFCDAFYGLSASCFGYRANFLLTMFGVFVSPVTAASCFPVCYTWALGLFFFIFSVTHRWTKTCTSV